MRNLLITISLVLLPILVFSQDKVSAYISNYQHIAIAEMNRSGIPASITLAQGMFESAYGQSPSAISYNNHFGIKCKKEWTGPYFYKHDDDRDKNGELIPSCFRAYSSVDESFQDHTNFLVERERYVELFTYTQTDYYNWAMGLERCGYATNKMYAERLVEIIERYALHQYDNPQMVHPTFVSSEVQVPTSTDIVLVATDAFSEITSNSDTFEKTTEDIIVNADSEELLSAPAVAAPIEENVNTLMVLESFKEFSSVSITPEVATNTIAGTKVIVEDKKINAAPVSRVNRAIILPANYQRKAATPLSEPAKMDQR